MLHKILSTFTIVLILAMVSSACGEKQDSDRDRMLSSVELYVQAYDVQGDVDDVINNTTSYIDTLLMTYDQDDKAKFNKMLTAMKDQDFKKVKQLYDELKNE